MEDDGEIEYLEEDEDIVQHYVQTTENISTYSSVLDGSVHVESADHMSDNNTSLLVERKSSVLKRKLEPRVKSEDDEDYDPSEDLMPVRKKKKPQLSRRSTPLLQDKRILISRAKPEEAVKTSNLNTTVRLPQSKSQNLTNYVNKLNNLPNLTVRKQASAPKWQNTVPPKVAKDGKSNQSVKWVSGKDIKERKELDIRIPDYEDPICLPARCNARDEYTRNKLKRWNDLCLSEFKKKDTVLKPYRGQCKRSIRTVIFRNMKNAATGKIDTTIQGKVTVENEQHEKRSELFKSVLPKFREKVPITTYPLAMRNQRSARHTYEVVLTNEECKDEQFLVAYKAQESLSAVYKFVGQERGEDISADESSSNEKRVLREVACSKVCAPCYQLSWRGIRKKQNCNQKLTCPICSRIFVSAHNLLSHLKNAHKDTEVRRERQAISRILAKVVEYHYKCRICQNQFPSIKLLRKHVQRHQGKDTIFKCEVGNHMAT